MELLILGLILFFGAHSIAILAPRLRADAVERFGPSAWQAVYGAISLAGLILIVWGYGDAHPSASVIYRPPTWIRHLDLLLMLPVFPLLFAAYLPGRIQSATKHPMLLAVKIWAFAHLLANGAVPDLLLFGAFLTWAVAERISLKRRSGPPVRGAPQSPLNDAIAIFGGLFVYLLFLFWLHRVLVGVAPLA